MYRNFKFTRPVVRRIVGLAVVVPTITYLIAVDQNVCELDVILVYADAFAAQVGLARKAQARVAAPQPSDLNIRRRLNYLIFSK